MMVLMKQPLYGQILVKLVEIFKIFFGGDIGLKFSQILGHNEAKIFKQEDVIISIALFHFPSIAFYCSQTVEEQGVENNIIYQIRHFDILKLITPVTHS